MTRSDARYAQRLMASSRRGWPRIGGRHTLSWSPTLTRTVITSLATPQFEDRADTTVVGKDRLSVVDFFGITCWPDQVARLDLGGRVLEITGIPGHHDSSISILDPWTGFLLTGDSVYPGRLYVQDMVAFTDSLDRLLRLAESHGVRHVLGCHIEMSRTPGREYPLGATYQPQEPPLQMTVSQLRAVRDAAVSVADSPGAHVFDDFAIFNGPCRMPIARQRVRRV